MNTTSIAEDLSLADREFKAVQSLIHQYAGIALADSKHVMVQSRLAKHVRRLQLDSYSDYLRFLDQPENSDEVTTFINALTTNKTDFFREKHHFDFLAKQAFPELKRRAENGGDRRIRIWCSASSTGEEPYTIAMCVREFFGEDPSWDIRILASDIDTDVLSRANEGVYEADRFDDVEPVYAKKYFERQGRGEGVPSRAKSTLRDLITFRQLNLLDDHWPINTSFDIIFCRNVMIYFDRPTQTKIVEHFTEYLQPDGYLIIGHSEALFGITDRFKSLGDTIYGLSSSASVGPRRARPSFIPQTNDSTMRHDPSAATLSTVTSPASVSASRVKVRSIDPQLSQAPTTNLSSNHAVTADLEPDDPKASIIIGEVLSSAEPMWITTLLGSCVAVCLYDDRAKVGGMNHFMLPVPSDKSMINASYGLHSMELLINSVMSAGGDRRRLKAKLFGGSSVVRTSARHARIGSSNVEFAEKVLENEHIPIVASFTERDSGMHIKFHTHTNKVIVRMLDRESAEKIHRRNAALAVAIQQKLSQTSDVTLF